MTDRQAYKSMLKRTPAWQITTAESRMFNPSVIPDAEARGFVMEAGHPFPNSGGGRDMFGIVWEYDPAIGGSMVRPGAPLLDDMNDWEKKLTMPDVSAWDWTGSAAKNAGFLSEEKFNIMPFMTGWFERLISLMDFDGAVTALIDEDQQDAVKSFFSALTDTYIDILGRAMEAFPLLDGFWIHDDWGGQQNTFFSPATCAEMIVPYMRRLTDFLHGKGRHCDFHSCGRLALQVPNMIAAGWDSWMPQPINDTTELYDRYGDSLIIGVTCDWPQPEASEEEQLEAARSFARHFCHREKPCILNDMREPRFTPLIRQELRRLSEEAYKVS